MHEYQLGCGQTACNTCALRADECSLKHVKSYSFTQPLTGQGSGRSKRTTRHTSAERRTHTSSLSLTAYWPTQTRDLPLPCMWVSLHRSGPALVGQVPHPNPAAAGTTHACVVISGAHRLQQEIENSISCCPCSGNDYLFMHGTASEVRFLLWLLLLPQVLEKQSVPMWHYIILKCHTTECWDDWWPFMHLTWTQ